MIAPSELRVSARLCSVVAPAVVLIYLQPNLGTALSLLVISGTMLFVGGIRWYQIVLFVGGAATAAVPAESGGCWLRRRR